jgi:hypothetical protein
LYYGNILVLQRKNHQDCNCDEIMVIEEEKRQGGAGVYNFGNGKIEKGPASP